MTTLLMKFQEKRVKTLVARALEFLAEGEPKVLLLESPTGSGKTVMTSELMERLALKAGSIAFIWLAPNKLHDQSLRRMQAAAEFLPNLRFIGPASMGRSLSVGDVLFLNWDSVNKKGNVLRKADGHERGLTLDSVITATREEGKKIILIIDESHVHVSAEAAQEVIHEIIKPDLTLEVSATPNIERYDAKVTVKRDEVVAEGLIRKEVVINPGMRSLISAGIRPDEVSIRGAGDLATVLREALVMRNRLAKTFKERGVSINPLLLVQFPEAASGDLLMASVEDFLAQQGVTTENGKLAVWLSDEKVNLEGIEDVMGSQEVLFFKQAIALGWDCPRAQVLAALRELKVNSFTAQVLGRVMRQPLRKHFELELLDRAYVFTNVDSFKLTADLEGILPCREVRATQPYTLSLPNWVESSGSTGFVVLRSLCDLITENAEAFIASHGLGHRGSVLGNMVSDIIIKNPDETLMEQGTASYALGLAQLEASLAGLVSKFATRFQNTGHARRFIRKSLEDIGALIAGITVDIAQTVNVQERQVAIECVLHPLNRECIETKLSEAIEDFVSDKEKKARELESRPDWAAPLVTTVKASLKDRWVKSLYPCYSKDFTDIELALAEFFEKDPTVSLWLKNGDNGRDWFALDYLLDGQPKLFYPDFIAVHLDGSTVAAEGKGHSTNGTAAGRDTYVKADRLQAWAASQRAAGHCVTGLIAVLDGGALMANDSDAYSYTTELKGWRKLKAG